MASVQAQDPTRFAKQIKQLSSQEHVLDSSKELIVFTGSSSIVRWKTLVADFPQYNVINHGFGGSQFSDLTFYYDVLVRKPAPDRLFLYEGDNDIAQGKEPELVFQQATDLLEKIRADLPQTQIVMISPKPSLSNWAKREHYILLNAKLKHYSTEHEKIDFIDVWDLMVDADGVVFQDIFVADGDHMNTKGYQIWIDAVRQFLEQS